MSNLQILYHLRKVDQHTGGELLIHDIKRCNENQLESMELPSRISWKRTLTWHKGVRS